MQITDDAGKSSKTFQLDLMFIFDELSEFAVIFVSNLTLSAVKNVVSFTQNEFLRKLGFITMRNYAETFYLYKGYNMAPEVLTQIS